MIRFLIGVLSGLLDVYQLLLVLYILMNILGLSANKWTELLRSVTEPVLAPVRRVLAKHLPANWQRFDWSPVAVLLLCEIIQIIL